jgi:16S rRNA (cytosine967-C5)-methyltransferase
MVGLLLDPRPGEMILDICAAPGGKACWAASRGPGITVAAADTSSSRLRLVRQNAARLGLGNILTLCGDGLHPPFRRQFHSVLVDAPCSGLGVLRRRLDLRWRIKEEDIGRLAGLQARLLEAASHCVRPGGALVYATCTLTSEENQEQVAKFLEGHPDFSLEPAEGRLPAAAVSGGMMEAWPHRLGADGAFAARLMRKKQ